MALYWISMPSTWRLQNVQAGMNVVITLLSTLGIFIFVRSSWQAGARKFARNNNVPLYSLLSLNTLGEALDTCLMLGSKLFRARYKALLAQCIVVVSFSIIAILAGPIARYSTRRGSIIRELDVSGLLTTRYHNGVDFANVEWNLTHSRLDKAGFPLDQLVDFLPDNGVDWIFDPAQWNSSWHLDCQTTPKTVIPLEAVGDCGDLVYELPGLRQAYDPEMHDVTIASWSGFAETREKLKDALMFIVGFTDLDYIEAELTYKTVELLIVAVHLHNAPKSTNSSAECDFGVGVIEHSTFTKVECTLERDDSVVDYANLAFPDIDYDYERSFPEALTSYYGGRVARESTSDDPITTIEPEELIRFYQVYTASKDTQYRQPVTRSLNVNLTVVQISTIFLTVAAFIALLIALGLINYGLFALLHWETMRAVPQSKLDWMIQSIQAESPPFMDSRSQSRLSVVVSPSHGIASDASGLKGRVVDFEAATYGQQQTDPWMNRNSMATTQSSTSPALSQALSPEFAPGKTPLLQQRAALGDEYRRHA